MPKNFRSIEERRNYNKDMMRKWRDAHPNYRTIEKKRRRLKLLQMISGLERPVCHYCGCDVLGLLEVNHKKGGGHKDHQTFRGKNFEYAIISGQRPTDDLEVACRVCNALYYIRLKFGDQLANNYKVKWAVTPSEVGRKS